MAEEKGRHGCLTAWLAFVIVANSATAFTYGLYGATILTFFALCNVIFAIALFRWKKWGFWGFCVTAAVAAVINLYIGVGIGPIIGGLAGVAILYGLLQIGDSNKGWSQLE
ncbi:MAG: hypothetical protein KF886_17675 [Candidatus Hydrogenedentes bacterium]|nr:hypothetical protein [Candidatus Hydrogenedentota bacterium]